MAATDHSTRNGSRSRIRTVVAAHASPPAQRSLTRMSTREPGTSSLTTTDLSPSCGGAIIGTGSFSRGPTSPSAEPGEQPVTMAWIRSPSRSGGLTSTSIAPPFSEKANPIRPPRRSENTATRQAPARPATRTAVPHSTSRSGISGTARVTARVTQDGTGDGNPNWPHRPWAAWSR